jgi:hypothetical protein
VIDEKPKEKEEGKNEAPVEIKKKKKDEGKNLEA